MSGLPVEVQVLKQNSGSRSKKELKHTKPNSYETWDLEELHCHAIILTYFTSQIEYAFVKASEKIH